MAMRAYMAGHAALGTERERPEPRVGVYASEGARVAVNFQRDGRAGTCSALDVLPQGDQQVTTRWHLLNRRGEGRPGPYRLSSQTQPGPRRSPAPATGVR